jgi:hypothetical protein
LAHGVAACEGEEKNRSEADGQCQRGHCYRLITTCFQRTRPTRSIRKR